MARCEGEGGGAFGLRGLGDDVRDLVEGLVDVGAEVGGIEDYIEFTVGNDGAAVVEFGGCGQGDGVRGADGVELVFAGLEVGFGVGLESVYGTVCIAVDENVSMFCRKWRYTKIVTR